jgi:hypothetical protein
LGNSEKYEQRCKDFKAAIAYATVILKKSKFVSYFKSVFKNFEENIYFNIIGNLENFLVFTPLLGECYGETVRFVKRVYIKSNIESHFFVQNLTEEEINLFYNKIFEVGYFNTVIHEITHFLRNAFSNMLEVSPTYFYTIDGIRQFDNTPFEYKNDKFIIKLREEASITDLENHELVDLTEQCIGKRFNLIEKSRTINLSIVTTGREAGRTMEVEIFGKALENLDLPHILFIAEEKNWEMNSKDFKENFKKIQSKRDIYFRVLMEGTYLSN